MVLLSLSLHLVWLVVALLLGSLPFGTPRLL